MELHKYGVSIQVLFISAILPTLENGVGSRDKVHFTFLGKTFESDIQDQHDQLNLSPSLSRDSNDSPCPTHAAITYPTQPTGHMTWKEYSQRLPGYDSTTIIAVTFVFYDGIQDENHPKPGQPYGGNKMIVCLPNSSEGLEVLKLFQKAFDARLLFTVRTSREENYEVDWNLVQPQLCKLNNSSRLVL